MSADLLFVTGASRSGTTLVSRILGNHSNVLGLRELHYFGELFDPGLGSQSLDDSTLISMAQKLSARQRDDLWHAQLGAEDVAFADSLLPSLAKRDGFTLFSLATNKLAQREGKQVACEQTPRNIFYAKQLLEQYPDAHIVHLLRDPRGVMASQKNRWQMRKLGGGNVPWQELVRVRVNYHPITMSKLWNKATELALDLADHPRCHLVKFEELTDAPEQTVRQLCEQLEIDFDPAMLEVPHWGSSTVAHSDDKKAGVSAQVVEQWRTVLSPAECAVVAELSGDLMERSGYPLGEAERKVGLGQWLSYPPHLLGVALANPKRALTVARGLFAS